MDDQGTGRAPAGEVLARNIRRIREDQRLTYVELAERLVRIGQSIPVLGLRRIERGERRVDVDDLLALAYALGVPPVDLLVPGNAHSTAPYGITPTVTSTAGRARAWIRGDAWLPEPSGSADSPFGIPAPPWGVTDPMQWMPRERAHQILEWQLARLSTPLDPPERKEENDGGSDQED